MLYLPAYICIYLYMYQHTSPFHKLHLSKPRPTAFVSKRNAAHDMNQSRSGSLGLMLPCAMLEKSDSAISHRLILEQEVIVALHATRSAATFMSTCFGVGLSPRQPWSTSKGRSSLHMQSSLNGFEDSNRPAPLGCLFTCTDQAAACELIGEYGADQHVVH